MSLDWNITNIKDRAEHFPPNTEHVEVLGSLNRKVFSAIWGCITTQIGTITEENADEWFDRYCFWYKLQYGDLEGVPFDRDDIHKMAGLSTNVFPDLPRDRWLERQWEMWEQSNKS